jgi:hypothetical protein
MLPAFAGAAVPGAVMAARPGIAEVNDPAAAADVVSAGAFQ